MILNTDSKFLWRNRESDVIVQLGIYSLKFFLQIKLIMIYV